MLTKPESGVGLLLLCRRAPLNAAHCGLVLHRRAFLAYVCALPVMNPDTDAFSLYLIYATRHAKGVEIFKSRKVN